LLESKLLSRTEVALALKDCVTRGVSLVQAIADRVPGALSMLESEFSRWPGPYTTHLPADVALASRVPLGMCERFLAIPLQRARAEDPVPLAVVDPFDAHAVAEFHFCLGLAVTPIRASLSRVLQSLDGIRAAVAAGGDSLLEVGEDETPAFGTRMLRETRQRRRTREFAEGPGSGNKRGFTLPSIESPGDPSEPPIPLVRTTLAPAPLDAVPSLGSLGSRTPQDSEPVLKLVKQKPAGAFRLSLPPAPKSPSGMAEPAQVTLDLLATAASPRQLIERLQQALATTAPCQAFFSVRSERFVLEWVKSPLAPSSFDLTGEQQNVLRTACKAGYFLGPLPPDGNAIGLGAVLGMRAREEIYIAPVSVANRAALVIVVGRFDEAFAVTRWVDTLVSKASQVLDRLVRAKKQS
jgi:hypothetical protein